MQLPIVCSSTKESSTIVIISKLSANYLSISWWPNWSCWPWPIITTDTSPNSIDTHLWNSLLLNISTRQANCSFCTSFRFWAHIPVCMCVFIYRHVNTQVYKAGAQVILTRTVCVISRQTIASDSICSITSPGITSSADSALSEIGFSGIEATIKVKIAVSSIHSKRIVTEHSSPWKVATLFKFFTINTCFTQ